MVRCARGSGACRFTGRSASSPSPIVMIADAISRNEFHLKDAWGSTLEIGQEDAVPPHRKEQDEVV